MAFIILISFTGTPQRSNMKCLENIFHYLQILLMLSAVLPAMNAFWQGDLPCRIPATKTWSCILRHIYWTCVRCADWENQCLLVGYGAICYAKATHQCWIKCSHSISKCLVFKQVLFEVLVKLFAVLIISLLMIRASSVKRWMFESLSKDWKETKRLKFFGF